MNDYMKDFMDLLMQSLNSLEKGNEEKAIEFLALSMDVIAKNDDEAYSTVAEHIRAGDYDGAENLFSLIMGVE